jgi:hypothetical protein
VRAVPAAYTTSPPRAAPPPGDDAMGVGWARVFQTSAIGSPCLRGCTHCDPIAALPRVGWARVPLNLSRTAEST